jgi:hypothetical protein
VEKAFVGAGLGKRANSVPFGPIGWVNLWVTETLMMLQKITIVNDSGSYLLVNLKVLN